MPLSQQSDATFVTVNDEQAEALSPRGTYVIPKNTASNGADSEWISNAGSTAQINTINNETVVVAVESKGANKSKKPNSLMTEEESDTDSESTVRKQSKLKKNPKELFK